LGLGAIPDGKGVHFGVYAKNAHAVSIALFDDPEGEPLVLLPLPEQTHHIWHGYVEGLVEGQLYALVADGPWDPKQGLRYNPYKFLLDPYAKALAGKFSTREHLHLAYDPDHPEKDLVPDRRSNARVIPKCVVLGKEKFDWQGVKPPDIRREDLILYEAHLKGFTAHPSSGVKHPGTYLGFIEKIPYLKRLGVNAVELLPVQAKYSEDHLTEKDLVNYWGYNTAAFFCLEPSYAAGKEPGSALREFKTLVRELHRAKIEIILDVVYNHSPEGDELGPTLHFRGLDNLAYYALEGDKHELRKYRNVTGCGNTLDFGKPAMVRLAMDSLRYLAEECHVDGFRFDLADVLGRQGNRDFHSEAIFFQALAQDPVLNRLKIIAEPWDTQSYGVGKYPVEWSEWNGKFRDTLRRFTKGDEGQIGDLAWRLTGSADLYGPEGRGPEASVNFVTCHDGFTLWDLVSYNGKHNEANRENNRDGSDHNDSWNCGVEGPTEDEAILALRQKQCRNFLTLLILSHGLPMLNMGDEYLRSQQGNNNPYGQDNALTWFDWGLAEQSADFTAFVRRLIALRKSLPAYRPHAKSDEDDSQPSSHMVQWMNSSGQFPHWDDGRVRHLAYFLETAAPGWGHPASMTGESLRLGFLINGEEKGMTLGLPESLPGHAWFLAVQTAASPLNACFNRDEARRLDDDFAVPVPARSMVIVLEKPIG